MQIRTSRLCTFTLISLLSLFGFAAQAGAQDNIFNQLGGSPKSRGKTGNAHKAKIAAPASGYSYSVLYTFCSVPPYCADGKNPFAGLIQDAAGNLYGTTRLGPYVSDPNSPCNPWGCGMVFKLAAGGGGGGSVSITLTSTVNPSYVDQSVTFSVVVSGSGATPTGSVTFKEGTTALGTVTLADGKASLTTTFTKSGTAAIVARALSPIV